MTLDQILTLPNLEILLAGLLIWLGLVWAEEIGVWAWAKVWGWTRRNKSGRASGKESSDGSDGI
jgi:hypothetical protein